jgi:hypothetical protein
VKTSPRADFPVYVRRQDYEEEPSHQRFFSGILVVSLNYVVDVSFVPAFEKRQWPWPPQFIDPIESTDAARYSSIAIANLVVMPSDDLSGREEVIRYPDCSDTVVFYVADAEFSLYVCELTSLAQQQTSRFEAPNVSSIEHLKVGKFLVSRIASSTLLNEHDKGMLGRG